MEENKKLKVLNLYAGVGGNRKLWTNVDVTAVEINSEIAKIYQDFFPEDNVIVQDAHQYLLEHFEEFDFIWSSPPCPSHSRLNFSGRSRGKYKYPDMQLYEEIIFLNHFFKGKFVIENVKGYYEPLIIPQESERHYFWANFEIPNVICTKKVRNDKGMTLKVKMQDKDILINNFHNYEGDKRTLINNAIEPELGLKIFEMAFQKKEEKQLELQKNKVIILEYGINEKKKFTSFKELNDFVYKNLLNKNYTTYLEKKGNE